MQQTKKILPTAVLAATLLIPAYTTEGHEIIPKVKVTKVSMSNIEKAKNLSAKTDQLMQKSERERKAYESDYVDAFHHQLRLQLQHITFGNRLVLDENMLLIHSRSTQNNGIDPSNIDLTKPSMVTAYELDQYLSNTGLKGLGSAFVQAELDYGVNAMFLVSLAALESSWGESRIANDKNNLFGYGSYDATPYSSSHSFGSKATSIHTVAMKIKRDYLSKDGRYFSGYTAYAVNKRYSSSPQWHVKVATIMNRINSSIMKHQDTHYKIPN